LGCAKGFFFLGLIALFVVGVATINTIRFPGVQPSPPATNLALDVAPIRGWPPDAVQAQRNHCRRLVDEDLVNIGLKSVGQRSLVVEPACNCMLGNLRQIYAAYATYQDEFDSVKKNPKGQWPEKFRRVSQLNLECIYRAYESAFVLVPK